MHTIQERKVEKVIDELFHDVVDTGLCTRCGACVGFCPHDCIGWDKTTGLPTVENRSTCTDCDLCVQGCSGEKVNFQELREMMYPGEEEKAQNSWLGYTRKLYLTHASDTKIRQASASGGIVTSLFCHLLKTGFVDGVLVLGMDPERPYQALPILTDDPDEVVRNMQSKYIANPILTPIWDIIKDKKQYALSVLPCQAHALRKMQKERPRLMKNFKLIVGLYCGNLWEPEATTSIINKLGFNNLDEVQSIQYRAGEWPGKIQVAAKNGDTRSITKEGSNYLSFMYTVDRCLTCSDYTAEYADIAVGDGWFYEHDKKGAWGVMLTRTEVGQQVVDEAFREDVLQGHEIDEPTALDMHSHHLNNKKVGTYIRIDQRRKRGIPVPEYNESGPEYTAKQYWKMRAVEAVLEMGRKRWFRAMMHALPVRFHEYAMAKIRLIWMQLTKNKKKQHESTHSESNR